MKSRKNEGEMTICLAHEMSRGWNEYLMTCYQPLMGNDAVVVYLLLMAYKDTSQNLEKLIQNSLLSSSRFEKARRVLEEFLLVKTYLDVNGQKFLVVLQPVMEPEEFLSNETYARLFVNERGAAAFEELKSRYLSSVPVPEGMNEITADFDPTRLARSWDDQKERTYERIKVKNSALKNLNFNFETFLEGMDRLFPPRLRTPANLLFIGELADIHGVSEEQMRRYVQRAVNPHTYTFNRDFLRKEVMRSHTIVADVKDPYDLPPTAFLASRQHGVPVCEADKQLIDDLVRNYQFAPDVVNVLIEYTLNKTNQQFSRAYVEKVAASWSRLKIDDRQKALKQIQEPAVRKKKDITDLPQWYENTRQEKADEAQLEEVRKIQEAIRKGR